MARLLAIAVCPPWVPRWWERNRNKLLVSCALGLPFAGVYLVQRPPALLSTLDEYLSFILLLAALFLYVGNAPNFMIGAMVEQRGVTMPTFLGYMGYSVAVLLPLFVLVTLVFFPSA